MKYHYTDSPLNFEGRPVVPLSNFDGVPGVPLLNFEGDPRPSGSGPTFILCSLIWFALKIKWLGFTWNATLAWSSLPIGIWFVM